MTNNMASFRYGGQLSTSASTSNVQLACNQHWIAFPQKEKSFGVCSHNILNEKPILLSGHQKSVSALSFGNKQDPVVLGSGSEDCVIVWYLQKNILSENSLPSQIRDVTVAKDLGYIQHISFSNSDDMISICVGSEVWIIVIETCELNTVIEGHLALVTASKFCPCQDNILVTISEDRTFKVWDVDQKCTLYHSPIISAYPFLSIAFHSTEKEMSIGDADGMVRIFALEDRFNCLHTLDLQKIFARNQKERERADSNDSMDNLEEPGLSVIGMFYSKITTQKCDDLAHDSYHVISDLLQQVVFLICVTTNAVFVINVNTCQLISLCDFRDPIQSASTELELAEFSLVPLCGSCELTEQKLQAKVLCFLGSLFQNTLHIVNVFLSPDDRELAGEMGNCSTDSTILATNSLTIAAQATSQTTNLVSDYPEISVLSKAPLCENSPLKAEFVPKIPGKTVQGSVKKQEKTGKTKHSVENQPVTFKTKIKSSGYTASPRNKMFSPKLNPAKLAKPQFKVQSPLVKNVKSLVRDDQLEEYNIPIQLKDKFSLCSTPVAINQITFSGDGKQLACALADQTAHVLNFPQTSKQRTYSGHNGSVQSVNFSHDSQFLLTSSSDNTACVWSANNSEPILALTNQKHTITTSSKDNPSFSKGINQASFYFVDKFILLSSGNTLFLYKYFLDFTKDDLKRYQSKSRYQLVTSLSPQKAKNIAHFACINSFYSYIVLCAGSDRSLDVFDMNVGRSLLTIGDIHSRNAHCINLNEGSKNFSLPPQTYDLFLTAAIADGVKMWDLRTKRCVRKYEGHGARSHAVGVAWSPCSKYFAVGSEDKSAYIYDVRQSYPCHRLARHTDVVYDVAFHPATSQLVTASLDGKLHFYADET